ncbi:hypothetical protein GGF45_004612 [Coemansia sp. RSA 551]|nr:hypothetical protein GGF45_004612 [Coemansia sp. RSA 551]
MEAVSERNVFDFILQGFQIVSLVIAGALLVVGSPYGSQTSYNGRLAINGRTAWILMELVSPAMLICAYFAPATSGPAEHTSSSLLSARNALVALWLAHYTYRAIIYPLRQTSRKRMHVGIMLSAVLFNSVNGYLNGRWLSVFAPAEHRQHVSTYAMMHQSRVYLGLVLFVVGMCGNIYHDNILSTLRRKSSQHAKHSYAVPHGGLFTVVSCPHFFCEIVEWLGFAVLSGSPAAWTFLLNVVCNLLPRAFFIHKWYHVTFAHSYPQNRKAVIPYLL